MNQLKSSVISGLVWTYAERISAQLVSLIVSIILARLLSPEEYGIISLILVFITFANVIVSDGFGSALIQKKDSDELDFSSMMIFSVAVSIVLYLIIFAIAPWIAHYYDMPLLTKITRVFALRVPIAAVNSIQQAYVSKKMDFKRFFLATLVGTIISGITGIILAYCGFGVWALVAQSLINACIDTLLLSFTIGWRFSYNYSFKRVKGMVGFGIRTLIVSLMISLYSNIRSLIIGKKYTVEELSYCNKGQQFPSLISVNINTSITKVLFPALSNCQDDIGKVKAITRRAIKVGTFLLSPVLLGLAAVSDSFISILLTDKWLPCVPYLKIMCIVYLLQPIQTASHQAMKALGESKIYLRLEIEKWIFGILVLAAAIIYFDSVYAVMVSALIAEIFATVINIPVNVKLISYPIGQQINDVFEPLLISAVMYIAVVSISGISESKIIVLTVQILLGAGIYFILSKILHIDSLEYVIEIAQNILKKIKKERNK